MFARKLHSLQVDFIIHYVVGLGKPQLHAKFEVAGFFCYENITESVFKRQIHFLSHPLGELSLLRVTCGLHL